MAGLGLARRDAFGAETEDLKLMVVGREAVGSTDLSLHRRDPGAHELDHPATTATDQVIVLLSSVDVFVEIAPLTEPLLADQAASHQEIQVAVDRGARDPVSLAVQGGQKLLGVDVPVLLEDLIEQREALSGDAVTMGLQVVDEGGTFSLTAHIFRY